MEALLRLSGLLSEQDADSTDLQTLERRLAEKNAQLAKDNHKDKDGSSTTDDSPDASPTAMATPSVEVTAVDDASSRHKSPDGKDKSKTDEPEVAALSEAMCSLVTNNYGDTRYIGLCVFCFQLLLT
jgi:hypothetical protein